MEQPFSRRQLLSAAIIASGSALAARLGYADSETPTPPLRLGSGSYTYECVHNYLTPPPDLLWGDTHGVAQDSKGRIYISHTVRPNSPSKDAIVVFDRNGKFLTSWGARFNGGGHGLDIRKEGRHEFLYHCDIAHHQVVKTDLDGKVIWEIGSTLR